MLLSTSTLGGHVDTIDFKNGPGRRRRRLHSDEFKADAIAAAAQPGVSMAAVALARGINANLLRRWVRETEVPPVAALSNRAPAPSPPAFVAVQLPESVAPEDDIRRTSARLDDDHGGLPELVGPPHCELNGCGQRGERAVRCIQRCDSGRIGQ